MFSRNANLIISSVIHGGCDRNDMHYGAGLYRRDRAPRAVRSIIGQTGESIFEVDFAGASDSGTVPRPGSTAAQ